MKVEKKNKHKKKGIRKKRGQKKDMWGWLSWALTLIVSILACIAIGILVNLIFNAQYPKTCPECDKRKQVATLQEATKNADATIDDGGDDI